MPTNKIPFRQTNYFTDLICDYIDQKKELKVLYNRFPTLENFEDQLKEKAKNFDDINRIVLANVLKEQYTELDISALTKKNIEALKKPNTYTITTGHQLNLFTGPLYFLYKIITTINLTASLNKKYPDYNFVPIYWMATEDHDFDEINYFNLNGKKLQWNKEAAGAVGRLDTVGLREVFKVLQNELGPGDNAKNLEQWFKDAYLQHNNLADATRFLANQLLGTLGLVILDADHPKLKECFGPHIKTELLQQTSFAKVNETNETLESAGYNVQVNPREINLFYLKDNLRERIELKNEHYHIVDTDISFSKEEFLKELASHPERFSPNVILRPLYQEVILPNLCYIGGGGELAYWFQLKSTFSAHEVTFPILLLRNSVLIRNQKQQKKLEKLNITDADLFLKRDTFINKKVRQISNIDIDFSPQKEHLKTQFKDLFDLAEKTDKSFLGAVKAQEVKQLNGLEHLEKRLLKAQKRKLADEIQRSTDLQEQLFPKQSLQERTLNFSQLYLEFGDDLINVLVKEIKPLDLEFLLLTI
ncbi:MAG: bacillithiol biosynthesis cysteine-adding enzyme BshC [Bacteroidia bacterium]|nr:bacillithiol biosynthesis cysteine-adding enzyme BshC [Bacteroidia bacterium]